MSWGGPQFVIAIVAISTFGWLVSTWIRARHGYPIENEWSGVTHKRDPDSEARTTELRQENRELKETVSRLEERLKVLERIATDPSRQLSEDIERLR
jgi:uncharacterized protein YlxW (UPF0749 family)